MLRFFTTHSFYLIAAIFSLLYDKHFDANEKACNRFDESITPFITQSIDWYDGLDQSIFFFLVFFLEKTELDLFAFCLLQRD